MTYQSGGALTIKKTGRRCLCRLSNDTVYENCETHNHDPIEMKEFLKMHVRSQVRANGLERPDDKPLHILCQALIDTDYEAVYSEFNNFRKVLYRGRLKAFRRPPRRKEDALSQLQALADDNDALVRQISGDVVMIARQSDLNLLERANTELFADGTFKYSPHPFKQMYTFHILKDGFYVPLVHFLVFNKTYQTYKKAIELLISTCHQEGINLRSKPLSIMVDFEFAMIKAIREQLPAAQLKGCRFHLHQNWWRKIQNLGLAPTYKDKKSKYGRWLKGIFGVSLLPPRSVEGIFNKYASSRTMPHPTPQISEFIDYLNAHYVGPDALCPPSMWAGTSARLTNNGAEAFHRHFGDLFGYLRANPTVWHFLRNLRIFNVLKDVKLR